MLLSVGLSLRRHVHGPLLLWQILPLALRLLHCALLLVLLLLLLREVLLRCMLLLLQIIRLQAQSCCSGSI